MSNNIKKKPIEFNLLDNITTLTNQMVMKTYLLFIT